MQRRAKLIAIFITAIAALSGCASGASTRVDGSIEALSPEERRLQALETKVAAMQRRLEALNTTRFDDDNMKMRDDMRSLRGEVEKTRFDYQQQDRRSKDLYTDLDRRLQRLETGTVAMAPRPAFSQPDAPVMAPVMSDSLSLPPPAPVAPPAAASSVAVISPQLASPEEEGAYLATFDLLKSGKYDDAIRGFRGMLDRWPNGRYADNAAYWMGEANYVKRDYLAALASFQTVLLRYPASAKLPDAMLKIGLTHTELKQPDMARAAFQQLIARHPGSNAAKLAQQRLNAPTAR